MTASLEAAHFSIDDVELLVVFVDARPSDTEYRHLKKNAAEQGMPGELIAVWKDPEDRMRFLAPVHEHPFLRILHYDQLRAQVNRKLSIILTE